MTEHRKIAQQLEDAKISKQRLEENLQNEKAQRDSGETWSSRVQRSLDINPPVQAPSKNQKSIMNLNKFGSEMCKNQRKIINK